ncbi:MAG: hypothetical protein CO183_00245 [Candidatus Zambryskibacteria bacterium CG_4_9_14_3_um_filter_42_9]|uniref:CYTH domain-containing protein n=1 Tax=Candidatus Zambryskibacteria bacterium CG22_combo_CG10-13_8_21_14_all_42_17 TaxID=1975118 RepID=A0A2H0BD30_9BACT|nr:MAG: hypothetical protein COX06_02695 [Candidatus Zambryskibacteria bacterium CG22_combo_CG10-13_8_21_14_all_42_17]PJA37038.1 MAG: hypothetical protein CO183_00245 [Candidatus Zambryskibacteria bacterium CG_4_9_14_3_um_filter_42_9]
MSEIIEIEIKSLLGDKEKSEALKEKIIERQGELVSKNRQLNHYFIVLDVEKFKVAIQPHIKEQDKKDYFEKILNEGKNFSVRTRDTDGEVLLVVKASIGDDSSSNGISRMEFETVMNMELEELDQTLLEAGLELQAKWSREREEYRLNETNICLDKNAGYGYLAEFERIVSDRASSDSIRQELIALMREFGVEELPQDRLERMFAHYNENWRNYYGTDKVFNIN